jgi:hypothetical protein
VITVLELQDNLIHTEGAKSLARAMKNNEALTCLNLRCCGASSIRQYHVGSIHATFEQKRPPQRKRVIYCSPHRLNRMGDEGIKVLCDSFKSNMFLEKLNVAANAAGKV